MVGYCIVEVLNTLAIAELTLWDLTQFIETIATDLYCTVEFAVCDDSSSLKGVVEVGTKQ